MQFNLQTPEPHQMYVFPHELVDIQLIVTSTASEAYTLALTHACPLDVPWQLMIHESPDLHVSSLLTQAKNDRQLCRGS